MQSWNSARDGGLYFTDKERELYEQLFAQADVEGRGSVPGLQAAEFLSKSGLDREVLKQIWGLADATQQGSLDLQGFSVALRLIAYAQAGYPVSQEMIYREPPALPFLSGTLPPPTATFSSGGSAASRGRSPAREAPTPRQLRKYGRLFCRKTERVSPPGVLPAVDCQALFQASGLDAQQLAAIWDLSDVDRDGQLVWPEFVAAMHLINRARRGQPTPSAMQGLSSELLLRLESLEPAQVYASQASRSPRSRSHSPAATSVFDSSLSPSPSRGKAEEAWGDFPSTGSNPASAWGASALGGLGDGEAPALEFPGESKKKKKEKKNKSDAFSADPRHTDESIGASSWDVAAVAEGLHAGSPARAPALPSSGKKMSTLPDFGSPPSGFSTGLTAQPVEHLEVLIEAEKRLVKRLRQDTEELNEELVRLEEACRHEEREALREKEENERMASERQHLKQQLEGSQRQLVELRHEHEGLRAESVLLRRDQAHFGKEAFFLQRLLDEYVRESQVLQHAIEALEHSNHSLETQTKSIEEAQREAAEQAKVEQAKLQKEQAETRAIKQALDSLRSNRAGGTAASEFDTSGLAGGNRLGSWQEAAGLGGLEGSEGKNGFDREQHWSSGISVLNSGSERVDPEPRRALSVRGLAYGRDREGV